MIRSILLCLLAVILLPINPVSAEGVGREFTIGIQSTKTISIRPFEAVDRDMLSIYNAVYESLVYLDDNYMPQGCLAESWEPGNNGKTWTFTLRSDIRFSDGTPITADDVVASAQYILDKANDENIADHGFYYNLAYFVKNITELDNILSLDNCRKLLIVEGSEQFIDQILANYCDFYINETNFKSYSKSNAHLGNEFKVVGYNGCNRINPEMLYSLAGLIQFGGTLILGVKDFSNLANQDVFADSDKDRFRADKKTVLHNNFLSRMRRIIADSSIYAVYSEEKGLYINKIDENQSSLHDSNDSENNEIPLTVRFWLKSADKVLFITGDRGAGKSTLLGKIANCLQGNVLVSAPGKSSLVNFDRAVISGNAEFVSIDQLIERENYEGLILIDEIASIPVHQLKQIISKYPKVILSGTIDGYEGTANGIKLRLLPELEEENIGYKTVELKQGYRNSRNDKLGILWNKLFNPVIEVPQNNADYSKLAIKTVTCEELLDNEELLLAIFSILSKNHYQSQPSDLRQILDVPSNIIVYMESEGTVVGVLWGVQESIPSKLVSGVFLGTRRPKGNLIPQTLAAHAGFKNAGFYRFFRIVRIAVRSYSSFGAVLEK